MKDTETQVPISAIEPCPWNTKRPIHGVYKSGLKVSLEYFDICDRIRIWPVPGKKGRYYALDGNQRLPLIHQIFENRYLAESLGLEVDERGDPDPKAVAAARDHPDNAHALKLAAARVHNTKIDVLIMSRLDKEDAILFNATFNRNHAVPDEAKVVSSAEMVRSKNQDIIRRMVRPERALVNPLPRPEVPRREPTPSPEVLAPFVPSDEAEEKYGPPPPDAAPSRRPDREQPKALVPLTLSLTHDGYKEIMSTCLKLNSRIYREKQILDALNQLDSSCVENNKHFDIDSVTVEIALLTINRHIKATES